MQVPLVMTIIGKDRTGLVETVAGIVAEHGGNWLESRMCRLGGEFAGILRIHVPADRQKSLGQSLTALQSQGIAIVVYPDEPASTERARKLTTLEIIGHDRPGIVREISHALASQGINVEELATECISAPMSGEMLFKARATLGLPESCDIGTLRKDLERIAADLMVDLSLAELEPAVPPSSATRG